MKVLFINPPYERDKIFRKSLKSVGALLPPLGLAYIAGLLEKHGHEVKIIEGIALCTVQEYNFEDMRKDIREFKPDVVGVSATQPQFSSVKKTFKIIQEEFSGITTFMGGPLISAFPKALLEFEDCNFGVHGEAEFTVLKIVERYTKGEDIRDIEGLIFRDPTHPDGVVKTKAPQVKDLDELPIPARHLLPMKLYKPSPANYRRLPATTMMTSRGCPYQCTFCNKPTVGNIYRYHSAQRVLEEIELLVRDYGIKDIQFFDDVWTLNRERAIDICQGIIDRGIDISWNCMSRCDRIDPELLSLMKKAGCYEIGFGVESGSPRVLQLIKKGETREKILEGVRMTQNAGIDVRAFYMFGFPTETKEEILQTIDFAIELDADVSQFMVATPYPTTELWEQVQGHGTVNVGDWSTFTFYAPGKLPFSSNTISDEDLSALYKYAFKRYYLRPKFVWKMLKKVKSMQDFNRYYLAAKAVVGM